MPETKKTLLSTLKNWILLRTAIRFYCWSLYRRLKNECYVHETENYCLDFKDPLTTQPKIILKVHSHSDMQKQSCLLIIGLIKLTCLKKLSKCQFAQIQVT